MRLLITSVGSLVGQNVLDAIENRRDRLYIIGINSVASNPRNFRCDITYLTPTLSDEEQFEKEFVEILKKEKPDIVVAGRDADVVFLADFSEKYPEYASAIPCGKSSVPRIMFDKYESFKFAKKNKLAFADSYFYRHENGNGDLDAFIEKIGYPLVVKPKIGFGSMGVHFIINKSQLKEILKEDELLFQEYLGPEKDFNAFYSYLKKGIPLYFDITNEKQCAGQTIIAPDGSMSVIYSSIVTMVRGYPIHSVGIKDPEIDKVVSDCAKALYKAGWHGLLNVQMKKNKHGHWKVFEFNPRMTGSTSARRLLGYDEFGTLTDIYKPEFNFPNESKSGFEKGVVFRDVVDYLVLDKEVEKLENDKVWRKK